MTPMPLDVIGGISVGTDQESTDASAALVRLRAAFDQASQCYVVGDYQSAGERFLSAALEARAEPNLHTRTALADMRSPSYRNAARAWAMAGTLGTDRKRLEQAAKEDPLCGPEIARILELLGPRP